MSKRYWIAAVAFGLICSAVSGQAQEQTESTERQEQTKEKPAEPLPPPIRIKIVEDQAEAEARQQRETASKERERADLIAQEGMNTATQRMAELAWWQNIATWVGAGLVFLTSLLMIQANMAAVQAAKASQAAVRVAEKSLEESAAMNLAAMRPYLFLVPSEKVDPKKPFTVGDRVPLTLKNCGQTPAFNVSLQINSELVKRPIGDKTVDLKPTGGSYGTIGPGVAILDHIKNDLTQSDIDRISAGEVLLIRIRISYTFPPNGSDSHDITTMLSSEGLATCDFHLISEAERHRNK